LQKLINEAVHLLSALGLPIEGGTGRRLERTALAFLALLDLSASGQWAAAKDLKTPRKLLTREIIRYWREHFGEDVSDSSYDDIRRRDLLHLYLAGIVATDDPTKDQNDGTRRYGLSPDYSEIVRTFGSRDWEGAVQEFVAKHGTLSERLDRPRDLPTTKLVLPSGQELSFLGGPHNQLQKAIIEKFLPRFGNGAEVLYVGDTAHKYAFINRERLVELKFFDIEQSKLPDVLAYSRSKNWIFLIEAVYSSGPISPERRLVLAQLLAECVALPVYVTAFLNRVTFRKFSPNIAWETEVWIASDGDHLIHFDGEKFLEPYQDSGRENPTSETVAVCKKASLVKPLGENGVDDG
jgi:type II restriction enzyme